MPKGKSNKRYTPEFKIKVVETMHREKLSYRETARQFDSNRQPDPNVDSALKKR